MRDVAPTDLGGYRLHDVGCLKTKRQPPRIGTWNVRSLYATGKLDNAIKEAKDMNIDILGLVCQRSDELDQAKYKRNNIQYYIQKETITPEELESS